MENMSHYDLTGEGRPSEESDFEFDKDRLGEADVRIRFPAGTKSLTVEQCAELALIFTVLCDGKWPDRAEEILEGFFS